MNLEVFATHAEQKVRPINSGNRFGNSILNLVSVNSEIFARIVFRDFSIYELLASF